MTTDELKDRFNDQFGIKDWPKTYEVDAETYANVCQAVFEARFKEAGMFWDVVQDGEQKRDIRFIPIAVGPRQGIMFKGVELILKGGLP